MMTHQNMVTKLLDATIQSTLMAHLYSRKIGEYMNIVFSADGILFQYLVNQGLDYISYSEKFMSSDLKVFFILYNICISTIIVCSILLVV